MLKQFFVLLFFFSSVLISETLIFRDGNVLEGKIIEQTVDSIYLENESGTTVRIPKKKLAKITFKSAKELKAEEIRQIVQESLKNERPKSNADKEREEKEKEEALRQELLKKSEQEFQSRSTTKAMLFSAVLPGSGLVYAKRPAIGIFYFLATAAAGKFYADSVRAASNSEDAYNQSITNFYVLAPILQNDIYTLFQRTQIQNSFDNTQKFQNQETGAGAMIGIFYIAQLVHTYIRSSEWKKEPKIQFSGFYFEPRNLSSQVFSVSALQGNLGSSNAFFQNGLGNQVYEFGYRTEW